VRQDERLGGDAGYRNHSASGTTGELNRAGRRYSRALPRVLDPRARAGEGSPSAQRVCPLRVVKSPNGDAAKVVPACDKKGIESSRVRVVESRELGMFEHLEFNDSDPLNVDSDPLER